MKETSEEKFQWEVRRQKLLTVRVEGHSRVLAMTKILPDKWRFITYQIERMTANKITVTFERVK